MNANSRMAVSIRKIIPLYETFTLGQNLMCDILGPTISNVKGFAWQMTWNNVPFPYQTVHYRFRRESLFSSGPWDPAMSICLSVFLVQEPSLGNLIIGGLEGGRVGLAEALFFILTQYLATPIHFRSSPSSQIPQVHKKAKGIVQSSLAVK